MPDIDLDAFEFGEQILLDPEPPRAQPPRPEPPRQAESEDPAVAKAMADAVQLVMEPEEAPEPFDPRTRLRALIFASRTEGEDHVVVIHDTKDGPAALCNCKATRQLATRPKGCWATIATREIAGIPEVP